MPSHPSRIFVRDLSYFNDRAEGLVAAVADGLPNAIEQVRQWHPRFQGPGTDAMLQASFSLDDARLVYALQHQFTRWTALADYLRELPLHAELEPFLMMFEAAQSGDWPQATAVLRAHPDLAGAYGTNGNTLLNLAASLLACPPRTAPHKRHAGADRLDAMRLLLTAGADAGAVNDRGWSPLHQAAYRNDPEMAALLVEAGASPHVVAHGSGGTPLAVALFWGHREVAETLAQLAIVPANLRIAAGLGRDDLVQACFTENGDLTDAAITNRGFYRPHSGFPAWRPSNNRQEILDEALISAAKSDRTEVMTTLIARGANIDGEPYRGTALIWAASNNRIKAMEWLLDRGAAVNGRTGFGGPDHGNNVTALHLAAQSNHVEAVRLLLARGADPTLTDALYQSTPRGWAEHQGSREVLGFLP